MANIYNSYKDIAVHSSADAAYVDFYLKKVNKSQSMMVSSDLLNDDGSITTTYSEYYQTVSKDVIDGHFWLEDMEGNIISDGGFDSYKHKLPCFAKYDPSNHFVVYQPVSCPVMEQQIIDEQVSKQIKGFDKSTNNNNWKATARQMWKEKARMLSNGFECLQYCICEHLYRTEKGEQCRIRFGAAGLVHIKEDIVFWFFGHTDNTKIGEWIVKNGISSCGTMEKQVVHDRKMRIREVPNAMKMLEKRKNDEVAIKQVKKQKKLEEDTLKANKAMEELLAELDSEQRTSITKKNKNKKKSKQVKK